VHRLRNAGLFTILLNDVLDAPGGERSVARRFKEISIVRVGRRWLCKTRRKLFGNKMWRSLRPLSSVMKILRWSKSMSSTV